MVDAGAVEVHEGEEPEEEFEAYFDPLNEVDLKVRRAGFASFRPVPSFQDNVSMLLLSLIVCQDAIPRALQNVTANPDLLQAIMPELTLADKEALAAVSALST